MNQALDLGTRKKKKIKNYFLKIKKKKQTNTKKNFIFF